MELLIYNTEKGTLHNKLLRRCFSQAQIVQIREHGLCVCISATSLRCDSSQGLVRHRLPMAQESIPAHGQYAIHVAVELT